MEPEVAEGASAGEPSRELPFSPLVGCLLSLLLGLAGVALVFAVGTLAVKGEIAMGSPPLRQTRFWLVNDEGNQGVALSTTSGVSEVGAPGQTCVRTKVRFFLWRTAVPVENADYCDCYQGALGALEYAGPCDE